ncbi:hypothetical protein EDD37DRAFT_485046 [Exophiala viscosa]|uniref:uncharacterized protein n=1 Tax=Exophiala viscosa TaxID=2486360 RepID=UPI00219F200B|nr:hypothetical protein EDD37DRAFT_485046 [Exophiala viscosa]
MAPTSRNRQPANRGDYRYGLNEQPIVDFANPPLNHRPKLFCCPVAESNASHLPRSFVNPGRHLMNQQLRSFLECADDSQYTFSKCEVSHIVEVTTRAIHNNPAAASHSMHIQQQWNQSSSPLRPYPVDTITPPFDSSYENEMVLDDEHELTYSTYQSMSTRYFIAQNSSNAWQIPPHSRQYRDNRPDPNQGRGGVDKYMEIPPFKSMPYTSESSGGGSSGGGNAARPWIPSCSMLMWCNQHNNFYEVHVLS